MKNPSRKSFKHVFLMLQHGKPGDLEKLALTADELAGLKHHLGHSALHLCAERGRLNEIKDGVTTEQLAQAVNPEGRSALACAAYFGSLHQVKGGVTAEQLRQQKDAAGNSALMYAADGGHLHLLDGDVTAADLAAERLPDNTSALNHAAFHGQLYLLKDGVTADQLAAARAADGNTALHAAAHSRCLDDIKGGATLAQMTAIKDGKGNTPLYWAAREGCLNQISGGVTMEQMKSTLCDGTHSAWDIACKYQNEDQIPGTETAEIIARAQAEEEGMLGVIHMCCEGAVHEITKGNKRVGERLLVKAGIDCHKNGVACGLISETHRKLGNLKEAFRFAVKAVELAPAEFPVWLNLGCTCLALNKHERAFSALEQCLKLNPRCAQALVMEANAKSELGYPPAEIEALSRKAVETDPDYLMGWQWLAGYLGEIGKHEESRQAHYELCKRKLGGEAVEFGLAEGFPAGLLVTKKGVALLRKDGLIPDGDPALN